MCLWRAANDVSHRRFLSLTNLAGGLSKLHSGDDDAVTWLTNYGGPLRMRMTATTTTTCRASIAEKGTFLIL